jgi:hypothetical protein
MDKTTINPPNPHGVVKNQGKNKDDFDPLVRDFEAIIAEH